VLFPKSAEEVAATQGVAIVATGAQGYDTDAVVGGVDQPIERI
jgi:peptide/nickel transport system ATP-binding protein